MRECRRWSSADDEYIANRYATAPLWQMARDLNRTVAAIKRRAQCLGIRRPHPGTNGRKYPNRKTVAAHTRSTKPTKVFPLQQVMAEWVR